MADTTVKYFPNTLPGAPVLNGTAGSLIAVLDACLKDGFGLQTITITVSSGVATATCANTHSCWKGTVALVAGATPAGLNGEKRVLSHNTNTFTFAAPGVADGAATGTITVKLAPAGWNKPFSGTNIAAYRSADGSSTQLFLRVDDTNAQVARSLGYASMTDINTGEGPFPAPAHVSGGAYITKSSSANATARKWAIVADGKTVILVCGHYEYATDQASVSYLGDIESFKIGDAYGCAVSGGSYSDSSGAPDSPIGQMETASGFWIARSHNQSVGSISAYRQAPLVVSASGGSQHPVGPSVVDNALYLSPIFIKDGLATGTGTNTGALRGKVRGVWATPLNLTAGAFPGWSETVATEGIPGRTVVAVAGAGPAVRIFVDITGPWA